MSVLADRAAGLLTYLDIDPVSDALRDGLVRGLLDPADRLSLVAHGDGAQLGPWQALTDPAVAPLWALPHAAQYTGGSMPARRAGESDDDYLVRARAEVQHPRGMLVGGPTSLKILAQGLLTGTRAVAVAEPDATDESDPLFWELYVITRDTETPDVDALEAALNDDDVINAGFHADAIATDSPLFIQATVTFDVVDDTVTFDTVTYGDVGDQWTTTA